MASAKVIPSTSLAYCICTGNKSVRLVCNTPSLSNIKMFSTFTPNCTYKLEHANAAEPAPETTTLTSPISFPANSKAFNNAADEIMAVPCWSSCITGMSNSSFNRRSISNDSGALMSSRLMPPKVGAIAFTVSTNLSMSLVSTSISKTSMSAKILNNKPFPSITGLDASGPISPKPKTAVPLEITATRLPLAVYL